MLQTLEHDGFANLTSVFTSAHVERMANQLAAAIHADVAGSTLRTAQGDVYGARNLLHLWPEARQFWRQPTLSAQLQEILGPSFGLVRGLFFDKPPGLSWSLPWHKDLTIAVKDSSLPSKRFTHPTRKAGVPHVEAPEDLLRGMLTARIHLDDVTEENGPLLVIPGSHQSGKTMPSVAAPVQPIIVQRGDVLLIRPLVAHCSRETQPHPTRQRRIVHLEFAPCPALPDGYAWHEFVPGITHGQE